MYRLRRPAEYEFKLKCEHYIIIHVYEVYIYIYI